MHSLPLACLFTLLSLCVSFIAAADLYKALDSQSNQFFILMKLYLVWIALQVDRSASEKDIRFAYKKLSKKFHPDKNKSPGAEEKFVEIAHGTSSGLHSYINH